MEKEEIIKLSDERLIEDTFFYLTFGAVDEAKKYKEVILKRLKNKTLFYTNITPEQAVGEFKKRLIKKANEERSEFRDEYADRVDYISICDLKKLINNLK